MLPCLQRRAFGAETGLMYALAQPDFSLVKAEKASPKGKGMLFYSPMRWPGDVLFCQTLLKER
jgi:hypothetical protein